MSSEAPPAFTVATRRGARLTVRPATPHDRVDDLLRALGRGVDAQLLVDGSLVPNGRRLVAVAALRHGATIDVRNGGRGGRLAAEPDGSGDHQGPRGGTPCDGGPAMPSAIGAADDDTDGDTGSGGVGAAVTCGPACSPWIELSPGRHAIGRAPGSRLRLGDPDVEPHHGVLEVGERGTTVFTQLTGRVPVRIAGQATGRAHPVAPGEALLVGSSLVRVGPRPAPPHIGIGSIDPAPNDPWRLVVRRAPAPPLVRSASPLRLPEPVADHPLPPATGLIGAAIGVVGALVMALLLRQPLFAAFALVGSVASLSTWLGGVVSARRRRRRSLERARSERARFRTELAEARAARAELLRSRSPTISATLDLHRRPFSPEATSMVWGRRADDGRLEAVVGEGDLTWSVPLDAQRTAHVDPELQFELERAELLDAVPVPVALADRASLALHGRRERTLATARSILVQLASWYGPADWRLAVVTADPDRWTWTHWLPHAVGTHGTAVGRDVVVDQLLAEDAGGTGSHLLVVVVDDRAALGSRSGPMRRILERPAVASLVVVDETDTVPTVCDRLLEIGVTGVATLHGDLASAPPAAIRFAGIDEATADRVARRLAPLVDPECDDDLSGLPVDVPLADVVAHAGAGSDAAQIARRWAEAGPDPHPSATIGASVDGLVEVDLVRDGPHGLIAGTTGSGKSELLRTLVVALAAGVGPDHLNFVLVDYKGGATFDACVGLPHTVGVVTDLDEGLAERALISLEAELTRRERALREVGADDLTDYRTRPGVAPLPRLVVVVDEFAALATELPDFLRALVGVAQRGRSLGVHLLLATQRPAGVVSDEIRANTNLRIAMRLHDTADAHDVVASELPARFSRSAPGRAAMRLGPEELVVFQSARCTAVRDHRSRCLSVEWSVEWSVERAVECPVERAGKSAGESDWLPLDQPVADRSPTAAATIEGDSELRALVDSVRAAARLTGAAAPHRPWQEPLPTVIGRPELAERIDGCLPSSPSGEPTSSGSDPVGDDLADVVGAVDDPGRQRRLPLRWEVGAGNLALVGSLGAGTTSTLLALAGALCRTRPPDRCHVYAIDALGDAALDGLAAVAHCGGVVRLRERERLTRLLRRLADEIDRRCVDAAAGPITTVLLVDGLGALRSGLSSLEDVVLLAALDRILDDGPAVGVVTAFTVTGSTMSVTTPAAERWLFHLDDPAVARALGSSARPVPDRLPGRMRIASSGLEAQVVHASDHLSGLPERGPSDGPPGIGVLPERVRVADLAIPPRGRPDDEPDASPSIAGGDVPADIGAGASPVRSLVVGLASDDLAPAALALPAGDHVFVGGLARTGRSAALRRIAAAWRLATPGGRVLSPSTCRPLSPDDLRAGDGTGATDPQPLLVLVDDAERVEDDGGVLREVLDGRHRHVTVAIAARLDAVRASYGHWTRDVARSRCGLIMTAAGEIDGDLLGVTLPRRTLPPPRPGLGWLVDGAGHRLVQVAVDG